DRTKLAAARAGDAHRLSNAQLGDRLGAPSSLRRTKRRPRRLGAGLDRVRIKSGDWCSSPRTWSREFEPQCASTLLFFDPLANIPMDEARQTKRATSRSR